MNRIFRSLGLLALTAALAACEDDPFALSWQNNTDTTTVYSMARPEANLPTAFNLVARRAVVLEAPTTGDRWDWALDTRDGKLVMLPPRAIGLVSTAGILPVPNEDFDDVVEAPADSTLYVRDQPADKFNMRRDNTQLDIRFQGNFCSHSCPLNR